MNFQKLIQLSIFVALISGCQSGNSVGSSLGSSSNGSSGVPANRTFVIQATASDPIGVSRVDFLVNNQITCSVTSPVNNIYSCPWVVPAGAGIPYQLQTKAYDAQNKAGVSQVVNVVSQ